MARYLVKVKGHKIDYMLIPKGMTVKQLEKRREQHKGTNIGSLRDYSLVRAENMTEAINTLLHKQRRIAPTERVRFKKIA